MNPPQRSPVRDPQPAPNAHAAGGEPPPSAGRVRRATGDSGELRTRLREVAVPRADEFARAMADLSLEAWYDLPDWDGTLRRALDALSDPASIDSVLVRWLARLEGHARIADVVLFYVVRPGRCSSAIGARWIEVSVAMAREMEDPSLLESLAYTLGRDFATRPGLMHLAARVAKSYPALQRALDQLPT